MPLVSCSPLARSAHWAWNASRGGTRPLRCVRSSGNRAVSLRANADWIVEHRSTATMILTGAIVVALFEAFNTLIPVYVRDVLDANPASAIYIFAPAGVGFFIATILAPPIILRFGERRLVVVSLACMTTGMMLFGLISIVAPIFALISPLRLLELWGVHLSDEILAASVIAIPTNFGSTGAGAAVDNFVNRHVPVERQGAMFGLKDVQDNGLTIFTILALGIVSSVFGSRVVMVAAPLIVTLAVLRLLRYSFKREDEPLMTRREAFQLLTSGGERLTSGT
jgi:MFS family permease